MLVKVLSLVAILALASGSNVVNSKNLREISSVSELSLAERLLTLFMTQNNAHYKNISPEFRNMSTLSPVPQAWYSIYDWAYMEFGSIVLASRHWGKYFEMPEINWQYGLSYCWCIWGDCFFCVDQAHSWTSRDSKFLGTETIEMKTDWTPKTFVQRYTIGNYTWWSPEGTTREEDFLNGGIITCKGFWAKLENVTFLLAGGYHFNETLGLQVNHLTIEFQAGNVSIGQNGCTSQWHGGEEEVSAGATYFDFHELVEWYFETYRKAFLSTFQTRLNCFLSEGQYEPPPKQEGDYWYTENCGFEDPYLAHFVKAAAMQMFQMMAVGGHE